MTLYKALTNFAFENVIVVYNGGIIYQGEAWKFSLKEYWLEKVYNINISYDDEDISSVIISLLVNKGGTKNENDA